MGEATLSYDVNEAIHIEIFPCKQTKNQYYNKVEKSQVAGSAFNQLCIVIPSRHATSYRVKYISFKLGDKCHVCKDKCFDGTAPGKNKEFIIFKASDYEGEISDDADFVDSGHNLRDGEVCYDKCKYFTQGWILDFWLSERFWLNRCDIEFYARVKMNDESSTNTA